MVLVVPPVVSVVLVVSLGYFEVVSQVLVVLVVLFVLVVLGLFWFALGYVQVSHVVSLHKLSG